MVTNYQGEYICKWPGCGHKLSKVFGYVEGKHGGPSAVKCPQCGAGLSPMRDAVKVTEVKERKL